MAFLQRIDVRCKNKLCTYVGTMKYYDHEEPSLVCPACGFKTLEQFWPELEKMFASFHKERPPQSRPVCTCKHGQSCPICQKRA